MATSSYSCPEIDHLRQAGCNFLPCYTPKTTPYFNRAASEPFGTPMGLIKSKGLELGMTETPEISCFQCQDCNFDINCHQKHVNLGKFTHFTGSFHKQIHRGKSNKSWRTSQFSKISKHLKLPKFQITPRWL